MVGLQPAPFTVIVMQSAKHHRRGLAGLSPRETDVLALMADGLTNIAIATQVHLSVKSVESVIRSIFVKLDLFDNGIENRRVMAVLAFLEVAVDLRPLPVSAAC